MEFSITRLEQVAKILAEEIKEQLAEKEGINEQVLSSLLGVLVMAFPRS